MSDAPPETPENPSKTKYEGPFKHRSQRPAPTLSRWLSPWRLYSIGAIAALGITAFYLLKLTFTPEMIRAAAEGPPPPEEMPKGTLAGYCLGAGGSGLRSVEHAPFCTQARPPGCEHGDLLQLTYTLPNRQTTYVYPVVVGAGFRADHLLETSRKIVPGSKDLPIAQWRVQAEKTRVAAAVVGLFSSAPLTRSDVAPWVALWQRKYRLLSRPPLLTRTLKDKGTLLTSFLVCLGAGGAKATAPADRPGTTPPSSNGQPPAGKGAAKPGPAAPQPGRSATARPTTRARPVAKGAAAGDGDP